MPGGGQLLRIHKRPFLLGDFLCHVPIHTRLHKVNSHRWQVLYIGEHRFLDREVLDTRDTELQFGNLTAETLLFNLDVGNLLQRLSL